MSEHPRRRPADRSRKRLRLPATIAPVAIPRRGRDVVRRWRAYRERQLELLAESNRLRREQWQAAHSATDQAGGDPHPPAAAHRTPAARAASAAAPGPAGPFPATLSVPSPFYLGFLGALGVLTAWLLVSNLTQLTSVITIVIIAVFLTLALNPVVEAVTRRGGGRATGVVAVFVGLIATLVLIGYLVVPPLVQQTATLVEQVPTYVEQLGEEAWLADLDARYGVGERATEELTDRLSDTTFISGLFGGVLGAAGWLAGGVLSLLTALILTLYFLAALPAVKDAAYKMVPASRRPRVIALAEEIMRRVGGYALGQIAVATINGVLSWLVMTVLGIPYAAVLAVAVGVLGLVPFVGATLGAALVAVVALFQDPTLALVVIVYYVVYQQIENYVIVPRVMARTVSVPGAVTVVAVFAGGTLLGMLGALIAIPVAAGLLLIYEEVVVPRQARR